LKKNTSARLVPSASLFGERGGIALGESHVDLNLHTVGKGTAAGYDLKKTWRANAKDSGHRKAPWKARYWPV